MESNLLKDTDTFGKMDPFCIVKCGSNIKKSSVAEDQGKKPVWPDSFSFDRTDEDSVLIQVYDRSKVGNHHFHGFGSFAIIPLVIFNKKMRIEVKLTSSSGLAGEWFCEAQFIRK